MASKCVRFAWGLAVMGLGLGASETGDWAAEMRVALKQEPKQETKAETKGLYLREGEAQKEPSERILGLRADRTPTGKDLLALEEDPDTLALAKDASLIQTLFWNGRRPKVMHTGPGTGLNVWHLSPLIRRIRSDIQSQGGASGRAPVFLDAGAGVGFNASLLVRMGARVVASDRSSAALAILRGSLGHLPAAAHIHLHDRDLLEASFPEGSFDGILASHLIDHLGPRDRQALLHRFRRWLRPGGRLYIQHLDDGNLNDDIHPVPPKDLPTLLRDSGFTLLEKQAEEFFPPDEDNSERGYPGLPLTAIRVVAQAGKDAQEAKAEALVQKEEGFWRSQRSFPAAALPREAFMPFGLYEREGIHHGTEVERILGMRADRTPGSKELLALEGHQATETGRHDVIECAWRTSNGKTCWQMDAAPGFGANVCWISPLIESLQTDFQAQRFPAEPWFLDAGAGAGFNTAILHHLGARVVANDQSAQQLAILRATFGAAPRIHLNDGSILDKAFPDATFHGILASHLLHFLSPGERATLVPRFRHWLRPGGRLYIQCFNTRFLPEFKDTGQENQERGTSRPGSREHARARESLSGTVLQEFLMSCPDRAHGVRMEDLVQLLEASGFTILQKQEHDFLVRSGIFGVVPRCVVSLVAQAGAGPVESDETNY